MAIKRLKAHGHIVQPDWGQTDPRQMDYIHNKPETWEWSQIKNKPKSMSAWTQTVTIDIGPDNFSFIEMPISAGSSITAGELKLQTSAAGEIFTDSLTAEELVWLLSKKRIECLGGYIYYTVRDMTYYFIVSDIAVETIDDEKIIKLRGNAYHEAPMGEIMTYLTVSETDVVIPFSGKLNNISYKYKTSYDSTTLPILNIVAPEGETNPILVDIGNSGQISTLDGVTILTLLEDLYIKVGPNTTISFMADKLDLNNKELIIKGADPETSTITSLVLSHSTKGNLKVENIIFNGTDLEGGTN